MRETIRELDLSGIPSNRRKGILKLATNKVEKEIRAAAFPGVRIDRKSNGDSNTIYLHHDSEAFMYVDLDLDHAQKAIRIAQGEFTPSGTVGTIFGMFCLTLVVSLPLSGILAGLWYLFDVDTARIVLSAPSTGWTYLKLTGWIVGAFAVIAAFVGISIQRSEIRTYVGNDERRRKLQSVLRAADLPSVAEKENEKSAPKRRTPAEGQAARIVLKALSEVTEKSPDRLNLEDRLQEDLGLDSLDAVELTMTIEDEIGKSIEDELVERLKTVGDVLGLIDRIMEGEVSESPPPPTTGENCGKCGKPWFEGAQWCPICGAKKVEPVAGCPKCGRAWGDGEEFCPKDGTPRQGVQVKPEPEPDVPEGCPECERAWQEGEDFCPMDGTRREQASEVKPEPAPPPPPPPKPTRSYDQILKALLEIGYRASRGNPNCGNFNYLSNSTCRDVGGELNDLGGFKMMQKACDTVRKRLGGAAAREIEYEWSGIGKWLG